MTIEPPARYFIIRQAARGAFRRLDIVAPVLMVVRNGEKQVEVAGRRMVVRPGQAVALSSPAVANITNIPECHGTTQRYHAEIFVFDPAVIGFAPARPDDGIGTGTVRHGLVTLTAAFRGYLERLADDLAHGDSIPVDILRHRVREAAVWLRSAGVDLTAAPSRGVSALVRAYIGTDPARDWCTDDIVAGLAREGRAMSAATLRRRLRQEGESFSRILAEVRLSQALHLLQSTTFPIARIAAETGYESASRFAIRFRQRFGLSPAALRGRRS